MRPRERPGEGFWGGEMRRRLPEGSRALVTGARGFLGRHLVEALVAEKLEVFGTSRGRIAAGEGAIRWCRCDLTDREAVRRLVTDVAPDFIFHLSSLADGRRDLDLVVPTLHAETLAAVNVLTTVAEAGHGRVLVPVSLEEPAPGEAPTSPYAAAKAATGLYARMFPALYRVSVVMARVFMAYGPGQPSWKLIPSTVARLLRNEPPVLESPDRLLDWIYVSDVAEGLIAAMAAPG